MDQNLKLNNRNYYFFSYTASLVVHVIILLFFFILLKKGNDSYLGKVIDVQMLPGENISSNTDDIIKEKIKNLKVEEAPDNNAVKEPSNRESNIQNKNLQAANSEANSVHKPGYFNFEGAGNDTSGLVQVYSEKTLNVKIKYPIGWTFVDQDNHNKLDGVTFWAGNGIFNPPPYIFLEVKEKYLFNPSRYKFSTKLDNSIAYYNDPEELEGQVSQIFYIRTDTDEDYSIKLIMNGKDTFIAFQPIFFGMIKSFNFGKSIF